jgi:hypothetical protein
MQVTDSERGDDQDTLRLRRESPDGRLGRIFPAAQIPFQQRADAPDLNQGASCSKFVVFLGYIGASCVILLSGYLFEEVLGLEGLLSRYQRP